MHRADALISPLRTQTAHIPALDGVRGLAAAMVMLHHFTLLESSSGLDRIVFNLSHIGVAGVDLFFVLSGFLITGILFDARDSNHYFRNFYARRSLRIFPLYYAVLIVALLILPRIPLQAINSADAVGHQWWYWLYLSNFHQAAAKQFTNPILDVTWSLAIEEQFYLVWPLIVLLCGRQMLMRICVGMIITAFSLRLAMRCYHAHWMTVYAITPARMDCLAVGAWLALATRGRGGLPGLVKPARAAIALLVPLLLLLLPFGAAYYETFAGQTFGFTMIALIGGAVVVLSAAAAPGSGMHWFFTRPWLCFLGRISYALYLCHVPIRSLIRDTLFGVDQFPVLLGSRLPGQFIFYAIAFAASIAVAWCSWHLFEKHFLKLKRFFETRRPRLDPQPTVAAPAPLVA